MLSKTNMYDQIQKNKRKSVFLVIIFIIVISGIGWAVDSYTGNGYGFVVIAFIFSIVTAATSFYSADRIALSVSGARGPIKKEDNPYVYRMVENIAITAGLPMPRVYVIDDPALNAFATGRDPEHASMAVTTGLISALENEELEGVIAHELSHIKNYDIRFMTLVVVLVGTVVLLADYVLRWGFFFGGRNSNSRQSSGILTVVGLVLIILSPIIAQLIKLAISRKREFLADASAALLTRYPEGLARALEKISHGKPLRRTSKATAHLYIASPLGGKTKRSLANLFSTHPPVEERIKALRIM